MNDQMYADFDYVPYVCADDVQTNVGSDQSQQPDTVFLPFSTEASSTSSQNPQYLKAKTLQKRFCHMLTTQKFCEWLKHEWLYSSVDREIFLGPNDFQLILREHFPSMKARRMCRGHWAIVRRIIGRPRRFSPTFLAEERGSVQGKRRNLHYLQHLTVNGSLGPMASEHLGTLLSCLPATTRVPPRLPVGTKVCLSLYTPLQGLYLGVIEDSCPGDGHYTVWVEELVLSNGLTNPANPNTHQSTNNFRGFHIVPDEDVFPLPHQSLPSRIPISALRYHLKENLIEGEEPQLTADYHLTGAYRTPRLCDTTNTRSDDENPAMSTSGGPLLSETVCTADCSLEANCSADLNVEGLLMSNLKPDVSSSIPGCSTESGSNFQTLTPQNSPKLFASLAKLFKLLKEKRSSVDTLKDMNNTAEAKLAENPNNITVQFQHTYAMLILHLDKLNQELKNHMDIVLMHVTALAQEQNMMHLNYITDWRRRCDDEAQEMVSRIKQSQQRSTTDESKVDLVAKLSALLIHLCNLSDHRMLGQTLACTEDLLKEIRLGLHPSNLKCFELSVEHFIGQVVNAVTSSYHARSQQAIYPPSTLVSYPHTENMSCM